MKTSLIPVMAILAAIGCSRQSPDMQYENMQAYIAFDTIAAPFDSRTNADTVGGLIGYDSIVHRTITIDTATYYLVEGDMLLDEYGYVQYRITQLLPRDTTQITNKLVVEVQNNKVVRWPENYTIRYSITKNSFRGTDKYNLVKQYMKQAADEWSATCNIKFFHDEVKDTQTILTPPDGQTFVVLGFDANSEFIASAFFPYEPPAKRRLLIDPSYFTTSFSQVGVLRHELGHVLGFRHEHIRWDAPRTCPGEDRSSTRNLTKYDPQSVMHYFCGEMGSIHLKITDLDREGSQLVYGAPRN